MKKQILSFLLVLVFALPAFAGQQEEKATAFIKEAIQEMIDNVVTAKTSREEKIKRFDKFFRSYADLEAIGKFSLGRYWKPTPEKDRAAFIDSFSENVVVTWERRFEEYSGQKFEFMGTHPSSSGDDVFVDSRMVGGDTEAVTIVWRVRDTNGEMKLVDMIIAGVSMLQTYRNEYAGVLAQNDGDVHVLIKKLDENTAQAKKKK